MNIQMEELDQDFMEEMEAINEEEEDMICAGGNPEPFREAATQENKAMHAAVNGGSQVRQST